MIGEKNLTNNKITMIRDDVMTTTKDPNLLTIIIIDSKISALQVRTVVQKGMTNKTLMTQKISETLDKKNPKSMTKTNQRTTGQATENDQGLEKEKIMIMDTEDVISIGTILHPVITTTKGTIDMIKEDNLHLVTRLTKEKIEVGNMIDHLLIKIHTTIEDRPHHILINLTKTEHHLLTTIGDHHLHKATIHHMTSTNKIITREVVMINIEMDLLHL